MSPTIHTSSLKASGNPIYKFSHGRKASDSGSDLSSASNSDSSGSSESASGGLSAAPLGKTVGYAPAIPAAGVSAAYNSTKRVTGSSARREDEEESEQEEVILGAARLVQLPNPFSRGGDGSGGGESWGGVGAVAAAKPWEEVEQETSHQKSQHQERPTFPASASVSLPSSTTALDYLLHQHNSSSTSPTRSQADTRDAHLTTRPTPAHTAAPSKTSSLIPSSKVSAVNSISDYLSRYHSGTSYGDHENDETYDSRRGSNTGIMTKHARPSAKASADKVPPAPNSNNEKPPVENGVSSTRKPPSKRPRGHDSKSIGFQFFHVEPCLYTHRMFIRAAKIFEGLKSEESDTVEGKVTRRRNREMGLEQTKQRIPDMDFRDAHEQIKTFELTFATLKYQELFREILDRTGFFHEFSNLRADYSLVCIILFDLQSRKFQRRVPLPEELEGIDNVSIDAITPTANTFTNGAEAETTTPTTTTTTNGLDTDDFEPTSRPETSYADRVRAMLDPVCLEIEDALLSKKTRLQSNIAKERIKRNAPTLEHLLPEQVRNKDETKSSTPVFCWVNQIKSSMEKIIESLATEGFEELQDGLDISEQTTSVFRRDPHCSDLLVFPPHLNMYFKDSDWVHNGEMVQQDKSSCLAPQTVQLLLGLDQDVIHVNVGTGTTTGHIASLIKHRSPQSHIWAFGLQDADKVKRAARNLEHLGTKNIKIVQDDFLNIDPEDSRYRNVRVIMITANCSKSAITSPVQFIVSEGEDMQILGELSQADSNMARVNDLTVQHELSLRHALKFPRVRAVVYTTRSRYQAENEQVVTQALEAINGVPQTCRRVPFKVTPPVLPFAGDEIGTQNGIVDGRFAFFRPTDKANGCFVAIIAREPDDPKETARSAIARARSRGMLGKGDAQAAPAQNGDGDDGATLPVTKKRSRIKKSASGEAKSSGGGGGLKQKLSSHKSPAAVGARLYQAGLISRMEQVKVRSLKPEHVKVIKHPAPFSSSNYDALMP